MPVRDDPIGILTTAADAPTGHERVRGYREALAVACLPTEADTPYMAAARARALCGLARDGAVTFDAAANAVEVAVRAGEPCTALLALAQARFAVAEYRECRETILRVPRTCFRSRELFLWRFDLWSMRACSSLRIGLIAEGLRYAAKLAETMVVADEALDLEWLPPYETAIALLDIYERGDAKHARRAAVIISRMRETEQLEDRFGTDLATILRAEKFTSEGCHQSASPTTHQRQCPPARPPDGCA